MSDRFTAFIGDGFYHCPRLEVALSHMSAKRPSSFPTIPHDIVLCAERCGISKSATVEEDRIPNAHSRHHVGVPQILTTRKTKAYAFPTD